MYVFVSAAQTAAPALTYRRRYHVQCSLFTGMIPVFHYFLITGKWYWEVVCESGMEHILILRIHSHFDSAPQI